MKSSTLLFTGLSERPPDPVEPDPTRPDRSPEPVETPEEMPQPEAPEYEPPEPVREPAIPPEVDDPPRPIAID